MSRLRSNRFTNFAKHAFLLKKTNKSLFKSFSVSRTFSRNYTNFYKNYFTNSFFKKYKFKNIFQKKNIQKIFGGTTAAFFYGAAILKNDNDKKIVILLSDYHQPSKITSVQQKNIIYLAQALEKYCSIQIVVEDSHSIELVERSFPISIDEYLSSNFKIYSSTSPLAYLDLHCQKKLINSVNIEYRHTHDKLRIIQEELSNHSKEKYWKELYNGYAKHKDLLEDSRDTIYHPYATTNSDVLRKVQDHTNNTIALGIVLDSRILNAIKNNNKDITIVCAGGAHIESVINILCQQGYKSELNIGNDPHSIEGTDQTPAPLENIFLRIMSRLKRIGIYKQSVFLAKINNIFFDVYNQFAPELFVIADN